MCNKKRIHALNRASRTKGVTRSRLLRAENCGGELEVREPGRIPARSRFVDNPCRRRRTKARGGKFFKHIYISLLELLMRPGGALRAHGTARPYASSVESGHRGWFLIPLSSVIALETFPTEVASSPGAGKLLHAPRAGASPSGCRGSPGTIYSHFGSQLP